MSDQEDGRERGFPIENVTIMRRAGMTAAEYMHVAIAEIDGVFGTGYAANNPALVAGFMQAAARTYHATAIGITAQRLRDALESVGRD